MNAKEDNDHIEYVDTSEHVGDAWDIIYWVLFGFGIAYVLLFLILVLPIQILTLALTIDKVFIGYFILTIFIILSQIATIVFLILQLIPSFTSLVDWVYFLVYGLCLGLNIAGLVLLIIGILNDHESHGFVTVISNPYVYSFIVYFIVIVLAILHTIFADKQIYFPITNKKFCEIAYVSIPMQNLALSDFKAPRGVIYPQFYK